MPEQQSKAHSGEKGPRFLVQFPGRKAASRGLFAHGVWGPGRELERGKMVEPLLLSGTLSLFIITLRLLC